MSNEVTEKDLNLDLAFLPSWAQESADVNRYAHYEGEREDRRFSRGKGGGQGRFQRDRNRGPGDQRGPRPQGDRGGGDRPPRGKGGGRPGKGARGPHRPFQKRVELPPLDIDIQIVADAKGVDSLTKQIRVTGRAYPLFDIARLVLQKDERFNIELRVKKGPDGKVLKPMFVCALDDTVWLNEDEALGYILEKHLETFYQIEKTPTDPPKGTYTFVAQCGMSGVILGPPNYHDYQNKLHRLHQERFANMDFERFRSRVKIVRDEEVVKKWVEEQSFKTEYVALNVPEPLRLQSMNDVREHFRTVHQPTIIKGVEHHVYPGEKARRIGSRELQRYVSHEIDDQRRFPLKTVTTLSQQFATRGLQFFKVNKNIVHVAVARPHFLDINSEPVSEGVKRIVNFVDEHPRCTVKDLVEALAPTPPEAVSTPPPAPAEAAEQAEGTEPATAPADAPKAHHETTEAQRAVLADLHWLVHQGHVIEFASGQLETAKKPAPKPQPAPRKKEQSKPSAKEPTSDGSKGGAPTADDTTAEVSAPAAPATSPTAPEPDAAPAEASAQAGEVATDPSTPSEPAAPAASTDDADASAAGRKDDAAV
ncbi:MAG TPA: hypothetical protein DCY13_16600 [Verrucomicrobiales bacterium]|nr:hypothetical protein [Verrucomicrobiales bacterium]